MEMRDGRGDDTANMTKALTSMKEAMGRLPEILGFYWGTWPARIKIKITTGAWPAIIQPRSYPG